jgi:hypothetical protein
MQESTTDTFFSSSLGPSSTGEGDSILAAKLLQFVEDHAEILSTSFITFSLDRTQITSLK